MAAGGDEALHGVKLQKGRNEVRGAQAVRFKAPSGVFVVVRDGFIMPR